MSKQRASIRDVAQRAEVSVSTVSRILNGKYPPAPATRERVLRAVDELDYVANPHARALIHQTTGTVAIVVMILDDGFLLRVVQSISDELTAAGKLLMIGTTGYDVTRETDVLRQMRNQGVDSIILVGTTAETDAYRRQLAAFASELRESGSRLVLCGRPAISDDIPSVEYDSYGGAYAAVSHLVSRGHRRVLLLEGPVGQTTTLQRRDGYQRALADLGGELDDALERGPAWNFENGHALMRDILTDPDRPAFSAVFAYNDDVAAGAVRALREAGLPVPEAISVVGFGDERLAENLQLTTVHIPARELGQAAARMALDEAAAPRHDLLGTHVVVRDSVAPAAPR